VRLSHVGENGVAVDEIRNSRRWRAISDSASAMAGLEIGLQSENVVLEIVWPAAGAVARAGNTAGTKLVRLDLDQTIIGMRQRIMLSRPATDHLVVQVSHGPDRV